MTVREPQMVRDQKTFENHCSKPYRKPSRAFNCSLFACFLLFQTGKNRMQLNYRVKRCGIKNQNRRQKVLNKGLKFPQGAWHAESLMKFLLICCVSYLNLEVLSSSMPIVVTGLNFACAVIIEIRIKKWKATMIKSSKAENNTVNKRFCSAFFITKLSKNSSQFVCLSLSLLMYRMLSVNNLS